MARTSLTYGEKLKLLEYFKSSPGLRHQDLACWALSEFGKAVGRSTITRLVAAPPPMPTRMPVATASLIILKWSSCSWSSFVYTKRPKFKKTYNVRLRTAHGESGSVDQASLDDKRRELQSVIETYSADDVFNFDETGLFFRMLPSQTLATGKIHGTKKDKARITVGLCCNLAGTEKTAPVIINNAKQPRCFRGVNYYSNKKAWMTRVLFLEWLHGFNLQMHDRKVLLLVDNTSSHDDIELANVRVCFLPPNTTSFLQPLDAGIIKSFKCKYKKYLIRWVIDQLDADGKITRTDVLMAIKFTVDAWAEVSENTIRNCWCHTGIVPAPMAAELKSPNDCRDASDLPELSALIRHLNLDDPLEASVYVDIEDATVVELSEADDTSEEMVFDEEEEDDSETFSHRDALVTCQQLSVYAFSQGGKSHEIVQLMAHAREMFLSGMKQQKITAFFESGMDKEM